jgi:hypothetical protein
VLVTREIGGSATYVIRKVSIVALIRKDHEYDILLSMLNLLIKLKPFMSVKYSPKPSSLYCVSFEVLSCFTETNA